MKLTRILLNSKQLNSTNQKDIGLLYFIIPLIYALVLFTFIYFNFPEYHAAEVSAKEVRWTFLKDLFQRGGIARVKRKFEMDKFAIDYYIKNIYDIPRFRGPSRNIQIFCEKHRKVMQYSDLSGYLFCPENKLRFISEKEAIILANADPFIQEELKKLKLKEEAADYFENLKSNLNWFCAVTQYDCSFSTAELRNSSARKAVLDPKIAEILKKNEDEFNKALEDLTKNDVNNRKSFNIVKFIVRALIVITFLWAFFKLCFFLIEIKVI